MTLNQAQSPSRSLEPGTLFDGRYLVISHIGAGAMANVYKVRHLHLDQFMALKLLRRNMANDPGKVRRFKREAKAASSFRHPNLVNVQGFGVANGTPYLVMELAEGSSLDMILDADGPFPLSRVIDAGKQIAAAVGHLHKHNIVHRDIKPSNIIATEGGVLKIIDFGVAKLVEDQQLNQSSNQSLTLTGTIIGTPAYMSPEQSMGKPVDGRSDIYSLGCLLFELATGKPPYEADTHYSMLAQHLKAEIPCLSNTLIKVEHDTLDSVLQKCLAKEAEDRYQTMEELLGDLDDCQKMRCRPREKMKRRHLFRKISLLRAAAWATIGLLFLAIVALVALPKPQNQALLKLDDVSVDQLIALAASKRKDGAPDDALVCLHAALREMQKGKYSPDRMALVDTTIGALYMDKNQPYFAWPYFEEAETIYAGKGSWPASKHAEALFHTGESLMWMHRWEEAAPKLERALSEGYVSADVKLVLGRALFYSGRLSEKGGEPYAWETKKSAGIRQGFSWQGKPWGAVEVLRQADREARAELKPWIAEMLAATYIRLGRLEEAKEKATYSANSKTTRWQGYHTLGMIALNERDFSKAREFFEKARSCDGNNLQIQSSVELELGLIDYAEGRFMDAARHFDNVIATTSQAQARADYGTQMEDAMRSILWVKRARDISRNRAAKQ